MIEPGRTSDGIVHLLDLFATCTTLAGAGDRLPTDRYLDTVDQTSFLLAPAKARSCRTASSSTTG